MPPKLIVVGGPVGAGKSTLAGYLRTKDFGHEGLIHIKGDSFFDHVVKSPEGASPKDQWKAAMRAILAAAFAYVKDGYNVIVDFILSKAFFDRAIEKYCAKLDVEVHYILLSPSFEICAQRFAARDGAKDDDYEQFKRLYDAFDSDLRPGMARHLAEEHAGETATDFGQRVYGELLSGKFLVPVGQST